MTQRLFSLTKWKFLLSITLLLFISGSIFAQSKKITGSVTDAFTGHPLIGATVVIDSLYIGSVTDADGNFEISGAPKGNFRLVAQYIGYEPVTLEFGAVPSTPVEFKLEPTTIFTEEIVVTALARGQMAAINEQISAKSIKNVVSSAKIQELPDATAAESIGRLPGITINRSGGEANKVSVRGLSPKFNNVTVSGVSLGSLDENNRSSDISMISPNILSGIEVSKALTADIDANSLGGSIELTFKEAPENLHFDFSLQGGYNPISDNLNDYKITGGVSNRFLDNKFGVLVSIYNEQRYRGINRIDPNWGIHPQFQDRPDTILRMEQISYEKVNELRRRTGGTVVLDYKLPFGQVKFINFGSRMNKLVDKYRNTVPGSNTLFFYEMYDGGDDFNDQIVNKLEAEFDVFTGKLSLSASHSLAQRDLVNGVAIGSYANTFNLPLGTEFKDDLADSAWEGMINYVNPPDTIPNIYLAGNWSAGEPKYEQVDARNRQYTYKIDYEIPFNLGKYINGSVKTGY